MSIYKTYGKYGWSITRKDLIMRQNHWLHRQWNRINWQTVNIIFTALIFATLMYGLRILQDNHSEMMLMWHKLLD